MSCAPFSLLGGPSGFVSVGVRFAVNTAWNSTDISICDFVKEALRFLM